MIQLPKGKKLIIDPTEEEYYNSPEIEDEGLVDEEGEIKPEFLEDDD